MNVIATLYRMAQLYAHMAHNLASGETFFPDHAFLGELYDTYEESYDSVVERMIGLGLPVDIPGMNLDAASQLAEKGPPEDTDEALTYLLSLEVWICGQIKIEAPNATDGTQNLLQGLADESEVRQYKLKQRLMDAED